MDLLFYKHYLELRVSQKHVTPLQCFCGKNMSHWFGSLWLTLTKFYITWEQLDTTWHNLTQLDATWRNLMQIDTTWHNLKQLDKTLLMQLCTNSVPVFIYLIQVKICGGLHHDLTFLWLKGWTRTVVDVNLITSFSHHLLTIIMGSHLGL
jgi:hypothetical protein